MQRFEELETGLTETVSSGSSSWFIKVIDRAFPSGAEKRVRQFNLAAFASFLATLVTSSIGYASGAGGAVTQATSKSTGVELNKICGAITTNNATLNAATGVSFTLTNSKIAATDVVVACIKSGASAASYVVQVDAVANGSCRISIENVSAGNLSEAIVINFVVIKAVAA